MQIHIVDNGMFKLDGGAMYGVVPKKLWNKQNPADEDNLCNWAMKCLIVEEKDRLILIDTGSGNKQDQKFFDFYKRDREDTLGNEIKRLGYSVDDFTDIFLTHCHFDHCGGATILNENGDSVIRFPKATIWSNEEHWDAVKNPNAREKPSFMKENIEPIENSGKLKFLEIKDGISFSESISVAFVYGHTTAMMIPIIRYKDKNILYCADLFPSVSHISLAWVPSYDSYPIKSLDEKKHFLEWANQEPHKNIFFFEHDHQNDCCNIHKTEKGYRVKDIFKFSEI